MKYPFTPAVLDALPEGLAELFRGLEDTLLTEICSRLNIADQLNEVTVQDIRALRSHGIDLSEIKKAIQNTAKVSQKKLDALLQDVVARNQDYYTSLIDIAHITQPETLVSAEDIAAIMMQTQGEVENITQSMAFLVDGGRTKLIPAKAYQWALDSALMQMKSGAIPYNQAITNAVKELADSGLKVAQYESGHTDQIDVAARRAVMTGVSQVCAKYTEQSAEWLDTPYYEVSAHAGARDKPGPSPWSSHKDWQGKVYSVRTGDIYPSIYEVCGLGEVDGLEGANCRHIRSVWVEGVSERTYTDEELANIDKPPFQYEGRTYTTYEATQKQRQIERTVRKLSREKAAFEAVGDKDSAMAVNARIRRLKAKYKGFSKAAGLREQRERMKVVYPYEEKTSIGGMSAGNILGEAGEPMLIGEVDFSDKKSVVAMLDSVEKRLVKLDYETNVSITSDGKVWMTRGEESSVNPDAIPSSLIGSYSYHNHPARTTHYSFSAEDVAYFIETGQQYSQASDNLYNYVMQRTDGTAVVDPTIVLHRFYELGRTEVLRLKMSGAIDPDLDEYHATMEILCKELNIKYGRTKKGK